MGHMTINPSNKLPGDAGGGSARLGVTSRRRRRRLRAAGARASAVDGRTNANASFARAKREGSRRARSCRFRFDSWETNAFRFVSFRLTRLENTGEWDVFVRARTNGRTDERTRGARTGRGRCVG